MKHASIFPATAHQRKTKEIQAVAETIAQRREKTHSAGMPARAETADDPHHLSRFLEAQENDYQRALAEIRNGRKRTHWMWYIFPQLDGLGFSSTAKFYSIKSLDEAKAYLSHAVLGPRLLECTEAVLGVKGRSAHEIFGSPDDLKLRSCATLFALVLPVGSAFDRLLDQYYGGEPDRQTLRLLAISNESWRARKE